MEYIMKYMFATIVAAIVIFGVAYLLARVIFKTKRRGRTALATVLIGAVIMAVTGLCYMSVYYHADEKAGQALLGDDKVSVSEVDGGFMFDGPGESKAIVFYPGAKVECEAYAPMMLKLAQNGFDCFLADMPLNFAIFGASTADKYIESYDYETWIVAGHSMGGIVAAGYAQSHLDTIDGVVLLASYSTTKLDDGLKVYSIYGSNDKCLEHDVYADNKANLPENSQELVIEGGNHSQFGNYGEQKGDGTAEIMADDQQKITVDAICKLFE